MEMILLILLVIVLAAMVFLILKHQETLKTKSDRSHVVL